MKKIKYNTSLPIGNLTSQIFAVFYLNELDHYLKEKLNCKYYIRYMDDIIILSNSKEYLKYIIDETIQFLKIYKLELNNKTIKELNPLCRDLKLYYVIKS